MSDATQQPRASLLASPAIEDELRAVEMLMGELSGDSVEDIAAQMVREHLASGGKRLRARLALAVSHALGGGREGGIGWASACEMLHNATLVHDDLQDGDTHRRGVETVWVRHGAAQAINAGDLMFALPYLAIARCGGSGELRADLSAALAATTAAVVRGQARELALTQAQNCDRATYLDAVIGKTSALFELPVYGAVRLAGGDEARARSLAGAFRPLGVLFQMQDDVLDLYGDKGREKVGSDLREGKVSALVVEHAALFADERERLLALLALPREATPDDEVAWAIARFRDGGALRATLSRIDAMATEVRTSAALASAPALQALAEELIARVLGPIAHLLR